MERLTERNPSWIDDELWESACEPDCEEIDAVYRRLKAYEDAEEQGLHLRLPCKVGTQIYAIIYDFEQEKYMITETEIIEVTENCNGWFFKSLKNILAFRLSDFGVRVFLTKSEAEEKLKELRGKENDQRR